MINHITKILLVAFLSGHFTGNLLEGADADPFFPAVASGGDDSSEIAGVFKSLRRDNVEKSDQEFSDLRGRLTDKFGDDKVAELVRKAAAQLVGQLFQGYCDPFQRCRPDEKVFILGWILDRAKFTAGQLGRLPGFHRLIYRAGNPINVADRRLLTDVVEKKYPDMSREDCRAAWESLLSLNAKNLEHFKWSLQWIETRPIR